MRRKKGPVKDLTYRTEKPGRASSKLVIELAEQLVGDRVVVWIPQEQRWKRGVLIGFNAEADSFRVKWSRLGQTRTLKGIWRLHPPSLFRGGNNLLPVADEPAIVAESTKTQPQGEVMATRKTKPAPKRVAKPKAAAQAAKAKEIQYEEERETNGMGRSRDKLAGLSEVKKRNIAKLIHRERSKSPATSWTSIQELIKDKYDWDLPGSMTGRRLLRESLPDTAEEAIIQQTRKPKDEVVAKPKKKVSAKKAKEIEEELEEDEEELDEEELEEEYEEELEEELDEDEDEEEEDEVEEEEPEPVKAVKRAPKRVAVKRGGGKKS